ncbi:MAG: histidine phosphatase family protein, partial [Sphingomonadales bacterium]|nr:histidine phosphatase family protein [Sphingomonadales bacterium]
MKTLTLLRHAKSGWDDPVARDFDRGLNDRGKRGAKLVGRHMRKLGLEF